MNFDKKDCEWALFTGIEQEGPNKEWIDGLLTLFVVGSPPLQAILDAYAKENCKAIYFGAGGRFDYSVSRVVEVAENVLTIITIESPDYDGRLFEEINSNARKAYWVIPLVWKGKIIPKSKQMLSEMLRSLDLFWQTKILVKIDTGDKVFITQLNTNFVNSTLKGYFADTLIKRKVRKDASNIRAVRNIRK